MPRGEERVEHSKDIHLSIVLPIYNEIGSVEAVIREVADAMSGLGISWELLAVDDGSTDGTVLVLRHLSLSIPQLRVIELSGNFGQTAAMAAGVELASGDYLAFLDGDGQNDPRDIPAMLSCFDDGDIVMVAGWRRNRQDNLLRTIPSKVANWFIGAASGVKLHDYGCTLKIVRSEVMKNVSLIGEMHRMIPLLVRRQGGEILEKVVNHRPRVTGQSKYGLGRTPRVIADFLVARFLLASLSKPMHFFGKFALSGLLLSVISTFTATAFKVSGQKDFVETPLPLIAIFALMFASLVFLIGIVTELVVRVYFQQVGPPYRIKKTSDA
jgi:glycosyltransferase involved in cell wall biosynthesis